MERESAHGTLPTLHMYTLILQAWLPFGPDSKDPVMLLGSIVQDPVVLLLNILQCEISPVLVISDHAFTLSEKATEAIRILPQGCTAPGHDECRE